MAPSKRVRSSTLRLRYSAVETKPRNPGDDRRSRTCRLPRSGKLPRTGRSAIRVAGIFPLIAVINQYGPFGEPGLANQGSNQGRIRYTGQAILSELAVTNIAQPLYDYKARIYAPRLGRFLQTDPIGGADNRNLYTYVHNDPLNLSDPTGLFAESLGNSYAQAAQGQTMASVGALQALAYPAGPESPVGVAPGGGLAFLAPELGGLSGALGTLAEEGAAVEGGLNGTALARSLGQAGEDAVGITGPKVSIEIPGSGQIRVPDALTESTLTEVKNVGSLSYTQQLRDFTRYTQANDLDFQLHVRPSTQLSGPLQQAIANGHISLNFIPGAR